MTIKLIRAPLRSALPARALIVDTLWIDFILRREKPWEMRSTQTHIRGPIALIRKGSGLIVGQARLTDSLPAQSLKVMLENVEKHRIPADVLRSGTVAKWCFPWVLKEVEAYFEPIPYRHPSGAVIWVDLSKAV